MSTQKLGNVSLADYELFLIKAGCKKIRTNGGHNILQKGSSKTDSSSDSRGSSSWIHYQKCLARFKAYKKRFFRNIILLRMPFGAFFISFLWYLGTPIFEEWARSRYIKLLTRCGSFLRRKWFSASHLYRIRILSRPIMEWRWYGGPKWRLTPNDQPKNLWINLNKSLSNPTLKLQIGHCILLFV